MIKLSLSVGLCVGLSCASAPGAHANLVTNGGFETETLDASGNPVLPPPGWSDTGDGISIDTTFPNSGSYDIAFGAGSTDPNPGALSQSIATSPGASYTLAFAVLDESGQTTDDFSVAFGGFAATVTGYTAASYTVETYSIPGADVTSAATTLSFVGLNNYADWNLDEVSLMPVEVVEPPGISLFVVALFGLAAIVSWKKWFGAFSNH